MFESMDLSSLLPRNSQYSELASSENQEEETEGWWPSLTWRERLIGCASCMILGYLLSFGSLFRLKHLIMGNPSKFIR